MRRARYHVVIVALTLAMSIPASLHAQVLYGSITGNVTDKSGSAVPTAKVDSVNVETGVPRQTLAGICFRREAVQCDDSTVQYVP